MGICAYANGPAFIIPVADSSTVPSIPAAVSSMGYRTETFFDHFTDPSTIDIINAKASGKNWYVQCYSAGATYANPEPPWLSLVYPDDFTVTNSVLRIINDKSGFAEGLVSTVNDNLPLAARPHPLAGDADGPYYWTDPNAWKGWTIKNGAYIDYRLRFDPTLGLSPINAPDSWISIWSQPQDFLTGGDPSAVYTELDFFEAMLWINPTLAVNAWIYHRPANGTSSFTTNSNARAPLPGIVWSDWNILGTHWVTAAENGGIGFIKRYVNGIHIPSFDVTWAPGDMFSNLDSQHMACMMGAGKVGSTHWPVDIDWFRVTQKSASDYLRQ